MMTVIYPGSFDPPTLGHVAIVERAARLFDKVVVVVANNPAKSYWFSAEQRVNMFEACLEELSAQDQALGGPKAELVVCAHPGLVVDAAKEHGARAIVKGLRSEADFRNEQTMAEANAILGHGLESIFLMSKGELQGVSSSLVRQIFQLGGDVRPFVPEVVFNELNERE